ncbi:NAD(P)-binding domain-containing protein (plasmid) [Streptomyces sp. NBC_00536]|uniref:NADPH-dependent F420 reductase n=1 Tax=Streptomyces sp. NBC_00536 TaxID=2975769 RepID=UPI002E81719F|nr:NAD(P)-binding domain-containing protein [Streptomyces sp. NBC_00536]WUC84243.1 NAD(P)-binding domain-containing protein [Streptomyces sp. NBC_00536]
MTRIAVLGSGAVGTSLATGLAAAGHRVLTGSTRPDRPRPADDPALAAGVRFTGHAEAAEHARIVFNTTPGEVSVALLRDLEPALRGRILVDVSNAAERSPEGFPAAPLYPHSSLAEEIQRVLPRTSVVKALNTMDHSVMTAPRILPAPATAFLSGDDPRAKEELSALLGDLGWPREWILDLGGLYTARALEWTVLMLGPFITRHGFVPFGLAIAH